MVHEANCIIIEHEGRECVVKQTSGGLTRRMVCGVQCGDRLMPCGDDVIIQVGETVEGLVLAFLKEPQGI